jgi:hypothetical protein
MAEGIYSWIIGNRFEFFPVGNLIVKFTLFKMNRVINKIAVVRT